MESLGFILGEGGICGLKKVFRINKRQLTELSLEEDVWVKDIRTENIDSYSLDENDGYLFYGDHIDDFIHFDNFPNTKRYLLKNFIDLAFERKRFRPIDSTLTITQKDILKKIIRERLREQRIEKDVLIREIEAKHKKQRGEKIEDWKLRIASIYKRFEKQEIFAVDGKYLKFDTTSLTFHNYWKWWKWTSPQNMELFRNPKIVTPYISGSNKFMIDEDSRYSVSAAINGITFPANFKSPDLHILLGLLNSRLYEFLHQQRAKQKDYRYEYFVEVLRKLPFPERIAPELESSLSQMVQEIIQLKKIRKSFESEFERALEHKNAQKEFNFEKIWDILATFKISKKKLIKGNPIVLSTAFKAKIRDNALILECFNPSSLVWENFIILTSPKEAVDPIIYFIYLSFNRFLKENQVSNRTTWRRGLLFSEVFLENFSIIGNSKTGIRSFLEEDVPLIIEEIELNPILKENKLFLVNERLEELNEELNNVIYKIFSISAEEKKIIEKNIEHNIPYLPV